MQVNIKELNAKTLYNLEQRRLLIKNLARKMILETGFSKVTKWMIRMTLFCIAMYFIHSDQFLLDQHDLIYSHLFN